MAISDQLTLLNNTKTAIRTAINNKGGSVGASDTFASYATAIDNLPSGGDNSDLINLIEKKSRVGLIIPSGVTQIGVSAFADWTYLQNITIPNSVTYINRSAFENCEFLTEIKIPENVTSIGNNAFAGCRRLTSVNIPSGVTQIGRGLMQNCYALTSINIPSGVTTIEQYAFASCYALTSINIPSGVTKIGDNAFQQCSKLTSAIINATTPPTTDGWYKPFDMTTCPIYVPAESVDAYKAASGWSNYASRIYPIQQVATVDGNPVYNYEIGNKDATTIMSAEMDKLPTGTSIEFAEGITNMGGEITGYTTVTLPSTFTSFIDQEMIGSSVTTLTMKSTTPPTAERNKFGGSGLTAIYVPAESVDTYKASGWSDFASIIQAIPVPTALKWTSADGTQQISIACEDLKNPGYLSYDDVADADLDGRMAEVESSAEIGDCVTTIGDSAFSDYPSLASITIPDSVTSIGNNAFQNCTSLESVTIPDSVTSIGNRTFDSCTSLTSVTIPDSVTTIGYSAFNGCTSLTSVNIPSGVTSIANAAFYKCTSLSSVTIPDSVTSIGSSAFRLCSSLESVTVNSTTPPTLELAVFDSTSASLVIYVPAESVESFKAATKWSTYADKIQAIPTE